MKRLLSCLIICAATLSAAAQMKWSPTYQSYINQYKDLAIEQMMKYKIPASITLAQGLFESRAGQSELAVRGNNHFGIKCHGGRGRKMYHDDDEAGECFRVYDNPYMSFEDHSKFLATQPRYSRLFALSKTDYKGWARGLKKAGYATDPKYADRLISIIELYDLDQYDRKGGLEWAEKVTNPHQPYLANEMLYVIARRGDTFKSLCYEFDISSRKLRKYNELPKDYVFRGGEVIYLEEKRKKATKDHIVYVVKAGDSMYSISQMFGIKLKYLYKMNKMDEDAPAPKVGDILRLR